MMLWEMIGTIPWGPGGPLNKQPAFGSWTIILVGIYFINHFQGSYFSNGRLDFQGIHVLFNMAIFGSLPETHSKNTKQLEVWEQDPFLLRRGVFLCWFQGGYLGKVLPISSTYGKFTYINPKKQPKVSVWSIIPKPECCAQSQPFWLTFICSLLEFAQQCLSLSPSKKITCLT